MGFQSLQNRASSSFEPPWRGVPNFLRCFKGLTVRWQRRRRRERGDRCLEEVGALAAIQPVGLSRPGRSGREAEKSPGNGRRRPTGGGTAAEVSPRTFGSPSFISPYDPLPMHRPRKKTWLTPRPAEKWMTLRFFLVPQAVISEAHPARFWGEGCLLVHPTTRGYPL